MEPCSTAHSSMQLQACQGPLSQALRLHLNHRSLLCSWCSGREQQPQPEASDSDGEAAAPGPGSWENHPELAAAVVVHHETILRLKRILLAYTCAFRCYALASLGLLHPLQVLPGHHRCCAR